MANGFNLDCKVADEITRFVYEVIFRAEDPFRTPGTEYRLVEFEMEAVRQFEGADILATPVEGEEFSIEVKAAVNSAGPRNANGVRSAPLSTFAQEITYLNEFGKLRAGWFVDPNKKTDIFAFCWFPKVSKSCEEARGASKYARLRSLADVLRMDVAVIDKNTLDYILLEEFVRAGYGPDLKKLRDWLLGEAARMRHDGVSNSKIGDYRLVFSSWLPEQPVNVLLPKDILMERAICSLRVERRTDSENESHLEWAVVPWSD